MYDRNLLKKFGMLLCNPTTNPLNSNNKFVTNDGEESTNATSYR